MVYPELMQWELNYQGQGLWGKFLYSVPFMLGTFIGAFLFARSLKKRKFFVVKTLICFAVCLTVAFFVWRASFKGHIYLWPMLKYALLFVLAVVSVLICYQSELVDSLFFCANGVAVFSVTKISFDLVGMLNVYFKWQIAPYGPLYSVIYFTLGIVIYSLIYRIFVRNVDFTKSIYIERGKLIISTLVILSIATYFNVILVDRMLRDNLSFEVTALVRILLLLSCFLVVFFNFDSCKIAQQKNEMQVIDQLNKQKKEQYEITKEVIQNVNLKYHDLKGQINELKKLAGSGSLTESLDGITEQIKAYETIAQTGNETLDVILSEKMSYCEKNGIVFNYMVDGAKVNFVETMDVVSLFGNILNNAIEAVNVLPIEKRIITLSVSAKDNFLVIHSDNYCTGVFHGNLPQTTKKDLLNHGFGLKSIGMVAKKYGGVMTVQSQNNLFEINVVIPFADK